MSGTSSDRRFVMDAPNALGQRLRARRIELGLTLAQVADRAGLSLPYVSNLERGRGNPTTKALSAIAGALDVELGTLLGNVEDPAADPFDSVLAAAPKSLLAFARGRNSTRSCNDSSGRRTGILTNSGAGSWSGWRLRRAEQPGNQPKTIGDGCSTSTRPYSPSERRPWTPRRGRRSKASPHN